MNTWVYDGSFEGFLSIVFECYATKKFPDQICTSASYTPTLLEDKKEIPTLIAHADRVWAGLQKKTSMATATQVYEIFLSELPKSELLLLRYIQLLLQHGEIIRSNYAHADVLEVKQILKQIHREVHRMHAFVRFKKTTQGLYYAEVDPDFDVLPLIGEHFEKRYADQDWMIYDTRRKYGILYDQKNISTVEWGEQVSTPDIIAEEKGYEVLWKNYFNAVNITERKNTKLHLRHMPKRYWKYLTEKQL